MVGGASKNCDPLLPTPTTKLRKTDRQLAAQAEDAYPAAAVDRLVERHKLNGSTTAAKLRKFLIDAGTVYLAQKQDQAEHQAPSALSKELRTICRHATALAEILERFPAHVHDFEQGRLHQKMALGGLGPTERAGVSNISESYQFGSPEYELARDLHVICRDENRSAVQGIRIFAERAIAAVNAKDFGGRLSNLALNRWADNVRNFWVQEMKLPFPHSMVGKYATSAPANFCIDAMALLDDEPTKANIMTGVRYARDSAVAWEQARKDRRTKTTPHKAD